MTRPHLRLPLGALLATLWACPGSNTGGDGGVDGGGAGDAGADAGTDAGIDAGHLTLDDVDVILGPEQVVFSHALSACEPLDVPDTPARAVRIDGGVLLVATDAPTSYVNFGRTLDNVVHDCTPAMISTQSPTASVYAHYQWPNSFYRVGNTIYSLVHDEYHDPVAPNCLPGDLSPANPCWWNSITLAVSTDDGHTFTAAPSPANLVAAPHLRWDPDGGTLRRPSPSGYMSPSSIVKAADGYYYSVIVSMPDPTDATQYGACLMRTADLSQPGSWRFWDGSAFSGVFLNPYAVDAGTVVPACTFIGSPATSALQSSLTFNTFFGAYLRVGTTVLQVSDGGSALVCGVYGTLSTDLLTWSRPKLLREVPLGFGPCAVGQYAYASLLDPTDTSLNFENTGATPSLYLTRMDGGLDRDLVRQTLEFRPR